MSLRKKYAEKFGAYYNYIYLCVKITQWYKQFKILSYETEQN